MAVEALPFASPGTAPTAVRESPAEAGPDAGEEPGGSRSDGSARRSGGAQWERTEAGFPPC